jgi:integrase
MSYDPKAVPREKRETLGQADDFQLADGVNFLSFDQAMDAARAWHKKRLAGPSPLAGVEVASNQSFTVDDVWADYVADATNRKVHGLKVMCQCYDANMKSILGHIEVSTLTKAAIENWKQADACRDRRRGKKPVEGEPTVTAKNDETGNATKGATLGETSAKTAKKSNDPRDRERAQQDTTNRMLSNLKAALNVAAREGKTGGNTCWREVKPFGKTGARRTRFLTLEEQKKLVLGCENELRPLVIAALYTGARYGELVPVLVKDFQEKFLHIEYGKGKGLTNPRDVKLDTDAQAWFQKFVEGRSREDLMFERLQVARTSRKELLKDWDGWAPGDQRSPMKKAVAAAGIARVTFHELRHSYASNLLNGGLSLKYLAKQLGHADTRMVDLYYGHIAEEAMQDAIEKCSPGLVFD